MRALELDDEPAREEHAVYLRLVEEQRQAAGRLRAVAGEMAAARDLPMGRHDEETMRSPEVGNAFRRFIEAEPGAAGPAGADGRAGPPAAGQMDSWRRATGGRGWSSGWSRPRRRLRSPGPLSARHSRQETAHVQAVILAGGFGTRLRPLTSTRPKPLIPFANEPFLLHTLRQLAAGGFTEVVLSTMYLPEAFDQLLPEAARPGSRSCCPRRTPRWGPRGRSSAWPTCWTAPSWSSTATCSSTSTSSAWWRCASARRPPPWPWSGCPTRAPSAWSRWTTTTASPPSWRSPAPTRTPGSPT